MKKSIFFIVSIIFILSIWINYVSSNSDYVCWTSPSCSDTCEWQPWVWNTKNCLYSYTRKWNWTNTRVNSCNYYASAERDDWIEAQLSWNDYTNLTLVKYESSISGLGIHGVGSLYWTWESYDLTGEICWVVSKTDNTWPYIYQDQNPSSWTNEDVLLAIICHDYDTWCSKDYDNSYREYYYTKPAAFNNYTPWQSMYIHKNISENFSWTITLTDNAWNSSSKNIKIENIDKTIPILSLDCWDDLDVYNSNVSCTASITESSKGPSLEFLSYSHNTDWWYISWKETVTSSGDDIIMYYDNNWTYNITFTWSDDAWNIATTIEKTFKIDTTNPNINNNDSLIRVYNSESLLDFGFSVKDQINSSNSNEESWLKTISATLNWTAITINWFKETTDTTEITVNLDKQEILTWNILNEWTNYLIFTVTDNANNSITKNFNIYYTSRELTPAIIWYDLYSYFYIVNNKDKTYFDNLVSSWDASIYENNSWTKNNVYAYINCTNPDWCDDSTFQYRITDNDLQCDDTWTWNNKWNTKISYYQWSYKLPSSIKYLCFRWESNNHDGYYYSDKITVKIDTVVPISTASFSWIEYISRNDWAYNAWYYLVDSKIDINSNTTESISNLKSISIKDSNYNVYTTWDNINSSSIINKIYTINKDSFNDNQSYNLKVSWEDYAWNIGSSVYKNFRVDKTNPYFWSVNFINSNWSTVDKTKWSNSNIKVNFSCQDWNLWSWCNSSSIQYRESDNEFSCNDTWDWKDWVTAWYSYSSQFKRYENTYTLYWWNLDKYFCFRIKDNAWNWYAYSSIYNLKIDKENPEITAIWTKLNNTWTNEDITVNIHCNDSGWWSWCNSDTFQYRIATIDNVCDLTTWWINWASYTFTENWINNICFRWKDVAWNWFIYSNVYKSKIDKENPVIWFPVYTADWQEVQVSVTCTDTISWCYSDTISLTAPQQFNNSIKVLDLAWNSNSITFETPVLDDVSPTWSVSYSPTLDTWTNWNVTVTPTCSDDSWCKPVSSIDISSNSSWNIIIEDNSGNSTNLIYSVTNIDKNSPSISLTCSNSSITNTSVSCTGSMWNKWPSPDTLTYSHNTNWWVISWNWTTTNGSNINYIYTDNWTYNIALEWSDSAWNTTTSQAKSFKIDTSNPTINTSEDLNIWFNNTNLKDFNFSLKDQRNSTNTSEETWLNNLNVKLNWSSIPTTWFTQTSDTSQINVTIPKTSLSSIQEKNNNTLTFTITDKVGNSTTATYYIKYDNSNPTWSVSYTPTSWTSSNIVITLNCSDNVSWCKQSTYFKTITANESGNITIQDNAGNSIDIPYNIDKIDKTDPNWTVSYSPSLDTWTNSSVTISINCSDNTWGSWCKQNSYSTSTPINWAGSIQIQDNVWNTKSITYNVTNIDVTKPNWTISYSHTSWTNTPIIITVNCSDSESWCKQASYSKTVTANESWIITIEDIAWNSKNIPYFVIWIDTDPPSWYTPTYSPSWWTNKDVTVNVNCSDTWGSWCKQPTFSSGPIISNIPWTITIEDNAGNSTNLIYSVTNIDKNSPSISLTCSNSSITNTSVSCTGSMWNKWPSPDTLTYSHNTNWWVISWNWTTTNGSNINYIYTDNWTYNIALEWSDSAWNTTTSQAKSFKIDTSNPTINTSEDLNIWFNNTNLKDFNFSLKDQRNSTNTSEETWLNNLNVKLNWSSIPTTWFTQTSDTSQINVTIPKTSLSSIQEKNNNTLTFTITDKVGNSTTATYYIKYDNSNPTWSVSYTPTSWTSSNIVITLNCSDNVSWCKQSTYFKTITANESGNITIQDNAGNSIDIPYNIDKIDKTDPNWTVSYSPSLDTWTNSSVTISINCSDNTWGSWCKQNSYSTSTPINWAGSIQIQDNVWNTKSITYNVTNIDVTKPNWTISYSHTSWTNTPIIITVNCSDSESWCKQASYSKTVTANESWIITIEDIAWNSKNIPYFVIWIDTDPPSWYTPTYSPSWWTNKDVTVNVNCSDTWGSWCKQPTFSSGPIISNIPWTITIEDNAGNSVNIPYNVENIDKTDPSWTVSYSPDITSNWTNKDVTVTVNCSDSNSWCEQGTYSKTVNSNEVWNITIQDNAGNSVDIPYNVDKIDKENPTLDVNNKNYNWNQNISIKLETNDDWWSWLNYSKYIWNNNTWCTTSWINFDNNTVPIELSSEWENNLYLCNKDKAWNETITSFGPYYLDQTPPTINLDIPNSKLAWENNFEVKFTLDDNLSQNITYSYDIKWDNPQSVSSKTINVNSEKIDIYSLTDASDMISGDIELFTITFNLIDQVGNTATYSNDFKIYPNLINESRSTITLKNTNWRIYANNFSSYKYDINLKDEFNNNIYNRKISNIQQNINWITWWNTIFTNMIDNNWSNALLIENFNSNNTSNSNWVYNFNLKSVTPWVFTQKFKLTYNSWEDDYNQNLASSSITPSSILADNVFKKPISWEILVSNDNWISWNDKPQIWFVQKYNIVLNNDWNLFNYSNWNLNINKNTIRNSISGHLWNNDISIMNNSFNNNINTELNFTWTIQATWSIWTWPKIISDWLNISYKLGWKDIKYKLDDMEISWNNMDTLWLKIVWILQGDWKSNLTWQQENFSEISKFTVKSKIRKNAYKLINFIASWQEVNWIKYVEGDFSISWNPTYETLIVKDWNVIIDWNLNTNWNKLWIIVLYDVYNVESDYNNKWNIYIDNDVTTINAIIYADWGLISSNNGSIYLTDSSQRTTELTKQLILNWSIITRNTIGWAILWDSWVYLLPWSKETNDVNKAMIYDLNYIRIWNNLCRDDNNDWTCDDYNEYFIINYDSRVQSDPPIGFTD